MEATQFKEEDTASLLVGQPRDELDKTNNTKGKTLETIAQKAGASRATAEQYDAIQSKDTEEQKLFQFADILKGLFLQTLENPETTNLEHILIAITIPFFFYP